MSYNKKTWENGEVIYADDLNNMEEGIAEANKAAKEAKEAAENGSVTTDKTLTKSGEAADAEVTGKKLKELSEQKVSQITPLMFGAAGDGVTNDTTALKAFLNNLNSGEIINLVGKTYLIDEGLELSNIYLTNGTIVYTGSANERIFTLKRNSGLMDIKIDIRTVNYASDVVYVDYSTEPDQWVTGKYIIDGVHVTNTEETTKFVENSTCVRIRYQSYQVIWGQTINNLTFDGLLDYGIYIEPWLKTADYNPVYNTSVFSNVLFKTVNCALKVLPIVGDPIETAIPATDTETNGGIGLYLDRFANQSITGLTRAFMDLHNTIIEGNQVIPWDYYGDRRPEDGIFKTYNSSVYLSREYSHDSGEKRTNSRVGWTEYSTGEKFTTCNAFYLDNVVEGSPYRDEGTKTPWSVDNARMIRFSAEGKDLIGMQFSFNNADAPNGQNTAQFGFHGGRPFVRSWDKDNAAWGELIPVHVNGNMPTCYSGARPNGIKVGDMKFDISKGWPIWWNGSAWIKADGTAYGAATISKTSQLENDSGFLTQHQSLAGYAKETYVQEYAQPKGSYLTSVPSEYVTETELNAKGFLTQHQSLAGYAKETYVQEYAQPKGSYLTSVPSEYVTETELNNKGYAVKSSAETWTFTLADGSKVTKKVVLA